MADEIDDETYIDDETDLNDGVTDEPIVTPDACYEHFVDIIRGARPVTSQELIAQAYLGVMLYHVGMQMSLLTRTLTTAMEEPEDDGDTTNGGTE